jgi:stage II sporulation protein D
MLTISSTYHRPRRRLAILAASTLALLLCPAGARAGELLISGAGWGHGVGMSQTGALGLAEHGWSYQAILAHYYTGTAIGRVPAGTRVRVLIGGRVRSIELESYVRGVIAAEMSASWPAAALQAQAVASRTYALTARAGGKRFDVYADTRSQVYRGVAARTPQSDAAVAATAGQVVTYQGRPAITYFFSTSGGRTENVENAFAGAEPEPWLRGVLDPYERGPLHSWKLAIGFTTAAARLAGLVRGSFQGIEVLRRGFSPRIVSAAILGSSGRTTVSGARLAARLGLNDSWAYFGVRYGQSVTAEPDRSGSAAPAPPPAPATPPAGPQGGVGQAGSGAAPAAGTAAAGGGTVAPA